MKHATRTFIIVVLIAVCFYAFFSGPHIKGYGIMLWDLPEKKLQDGDIVPVYIKSNISHVYVIGLPHSKEKIEIPEWQVTDPHMWIKTKYHLKKYREFLHKYAHVVLDGLPVRSEPVNTSKQVYRLRQNETVKILYKGKGQTVMVGKTALAGDWLRIITQDGTQGWCFSNNLRLFETGQGGTVVSSQSENIQEEDTTLKDMLSRKWYPDYYTAMISDQHIDLSSFSASFGFDTGASSGTVSLTMPSLQVSWPYSGVTKMPDGTYKYNGIPVEITVRSSDFIVVRYTDDDGKPQDYNMVTVSENIGELIEAEKERRAKELSRIVESGPAFRSSNYGQLLFNKDNTFTWTGYSLLVPSLIASSAGEHGTVSVQYFIAGTLKGQYDGILTFTFDGMSRGVNFLYKIEDTGLRLEDASGASMDGRTVKSRGVSPLILFFAR